MADQPLQIIFAGTPEFAVPSLQALLSSAHQVLAVYTQPDRSAGRGQKLTMSPVKQLALQHQIPVMQPQNLSNVATQQQLQAWNADLMIVAAYGLILPRAVLTVPRLGCINVHASLLPRWRGAAPIQRAILAGDRMTGITIMQMDAGLDTGAMLKTVDCVINDHDTLQSLHDRLAKLGSEALLSVLPELATLKPQSQDVSLATYAAKITKQEGLINWNNAAVDIERQLRAFNPWPMGYTLIAGQNLRILAAQVIAQDTQVSPGTILAASDAGIDVATGKQVLRILQLQLPGGKPLTTAQCLNARATMFSPGTRLGT